MLVVLILTLREHIPLKQGLRQCHAYFYAYFPQRAYSTKTRIKTVLMLVVLILPWLREHIPLKQGLRPLPLFVFNALLMRRY